MSFFSQKFNIRWAAGLVVFLALSFSFYNIMLPVGFHSDELKKGEFVLTGHQDFQHPILLLQLTRLINSSFGNQDAAQAVLLGRLISALASVGMVVVVHQLARRSLSSVQSLLCAAAVAASPILVIHAHYFKEDILFIFCALLALLALVRYVEKSSLQRTVIFGIALGLALSSHYKAIFLVPIFLLVGLIQLPGKVILLRTYYKGLFEGLLVAGLTFFVVNWPILFELDVFIKGINYEAQHAMIGHDVRIYPLPNFFSFHLINSLVPGMTLPALIISLVATIFLAVKWLKITWLDRTFIVLAIVYYFVVESSPLKPAPDFMRYVIPVVPPLIYIAFRAVTLFSGITRKIMYGILSVFLVLVPAVYSGVLDYFLINDTRLTVENILDKEGLSDKAYFENYSRRRIYESQTQYLASSLTNIDLYKKQGIKVFVASSFIYDRFAMGAKLPGQDQKVYDYNECYNELFKLPYTEIKPTFKSFAFSNPTLRIIDITGQTLPPDKITKCVKE